MIVPLRRVWEAGSQPTANLKSYIMIQMHFLFHTSMVDPEVVHYFTDCHCWSCPKHVEAKKLANKYWNQLNGILHKQQKCWDEVVDVDIDLVCKKLNGLCEKYAKIDHEFQGVIRGIRKCGCD